MPCRTSTPDSLVRVRDPIDPALTASTQVSNQITSGSDCTAAFRAAYENRYTWEPDFGGYQGRCIWEQAGDAGEDGKRVEPGSGESGLVAVGGAIPVGYYKDEVKTAQTFRTFEGRRWTVPGDWAEVNTDGTLHLLGRGSVCINTGGEKVFPEEVEEMVKTHSSVRDAVAVGIPDTRFGETICVVVEAEPGETPTLEALSAHVKARLAAYKSPRNVVVISTIGRAPNGKVDYKRLKQHAIDTLGAQ